VVELKDEIVGFIVDSVTTAQHALTSEIEPAPALALTIDSRFVRGVVQREAGMIVMLNPFEILFDDEISRLGQAMVRVEKSGITAQG
jgi:chemotaxis signal transduction protein